MSIPVLIIGKSGSGKSASLRNFSQADIGVINVLGKRFPFPGKLDTLVTDDYARVMAQIGTSTRDVVVVDDAGYLITNQFMRGHSSTGAGNGIFAFYNQIADNFWHMIDDVVRVKDNKRIYFLMHEEKNDMGDVKPKTIGKLLDEKICVEGLFTICLRATIRDGRHVFLTQSDGFDVVKTPMGMFDKAEIDNDLSYVDQRICEYYGITEEAKTA